MGGIVVVGALALLLAMTGAAAADASAGAVSSADAGTQHRSPPGVVARYFPPSVTGRTVSCPKDDGGEAPLSVLDDFEADWFAAHLNAAREPGLAEGRTRPGRTTWRLLILPSFQHTAIIRFDRDGAGPIHATVKVLSGQGGYGPGRLTLTKQLVLTKREQTRFLAALKSSQIAEAPERECPLPTNTVYMDGTEWVLEIRQGARYRIYALGMPQDSGPASEVGEAMFPVVERRHPRRQ